MCEIWRLQTKTETSVKNNLIPDVAKELIKRKMIGMGWSFREDIFNELEEKEKIKLKEEEKEIKNNFKKYKEIVEKEYKTKSGSKKFFNGKVNNNIKRLVEMKKDDLVWIRSEGKYFLGRITEKSRYLYAYRDDKNDSKILKLGINNQLTNIDWYEIGDESDIPGCISTSFIKGNTLNRIKKNGSLGISKILYNKKYQEKYSEKYYTTSENQINLKDNFYSLLTPKDCEDLVYFYLYNKYGYVVVPATNKIYTQTYEFVILDPKNRREKIYIQVKNGEDPSYIDLYLEDYENLDGKVYLFTTGKIYKDRDKNERKLLENLKDCEKEIGKTNSGKIIYALNSDFLYNFAKEAYKNSNILLSQSILQWFEYLK